jgi:hypothetical protein
MSSVYTVNVYQAHDLNGTSPLFSPEPGHVLVLIALDVYFQGTIGGNAYLYGAQNQVIWHNVFGLTPAGQYASWRGRAVIEEGRTSYLRTDQDMDLTLSGYSLTLP